MKHILQTLFMAVLIGGIVAVLSFSSAPITVDAYAIYFNGVNLR